jgi:gliding motility-associated-like protein
MLLNAEKYWQKRLSYKQLCNLNIKLFFAVIYFLFFIFCLLPAKAQQSITGNNGKTFTVCKPYCTDIKLQIPQLKKSSDYTFSAIPYNPYAYTTTGGLVDSLIYGGIGGVSFSRTCSIPFGFCFYDSVYSHVVLSGNGFITFDTLNSFDVGSCVPGVTITVPLPSVFGSCAGQRYSRASIFGVYTDLDGGTGPFPTFPFFWPSPADRKIERRTEGTAPYRRFIVSYYKIGTWRQDIACSLNNPATFQMVLYESTGIVEIYIDNFSCPVDGGIVPRTICGMQNWYGTKAITPPGKNATNWTAFHEAYRFTPSGSTRFVSCQLQTLNGILIANADTGTNNADSTLLDISFQNVCTDSATKYLIKTLYSDCLSGIPVESVDTITISAFRNPEPTAAITSNCNGAGHVIMLPPNGFFYNYSLDDTSTLHSAAVIDTFRNVAAGWHKVYYTIPSVNAPCINYVDVYLAPRLSATYTTVSPSSCTNTTTVHVSGGYKPYTFYLDTDSMNRQTDSVFNNIAPGIHTVHFTDSLQCSDSLQVTIPSGVPFTANAVSASATCNGNDGKITITPVGGSGSYQYSIDSGAHYQISSIFTDTVGNYPNILIKDAAGCIAATSAVITLNDTMRLAFSPSSFTACADSATMLLPLTNTATNIFNWLPNDGSLSANNISSPIAKPADTTIYTLTAEWGRCVRSATVTINVLTKPIAHAGDDVYVCNGKTATLNGHATNTAGPVNYVWIPSDSLTNANSNTAISNKKTSQLYTLQVGDNYGCGFTSTDDVQVTILPPAFAYAGNDITAVPGESFTLAGSEAASWYWYSLPPVAISGSGSRTPTATITGDTKFILEITDAGGCAASDTLLVTAINSPAYYIPNAFTPGKPVNNKFAVVTYGTRLSARLSVFNRWGQLLFQSTNITQGWDGRFKGKEQLAGVYVWSLIGTDSNGRLVEKKGTVTLLR